MKPKLYCITLLMAILFSITYTNAQLLVEQQENVNAKTESKFSCESLSFLAKSLSDPNYQYSNFKKTIDQLTGRVKTIEVGIYGGGGISKWIIFNVIFNMNTISLVHAESSSDTAIQIKMNNDGFAEYTIDGNKPDENFFPTKFTYENGKVISRIIRFNETELVTNFSYDRNNNLVLMQDLSLNDDLPGHSEYSYDVKRTAKNQAYFDEPRGFTDNTYMLLQYLDLLPLKPVNIRTSSKVYWEDDYLAYDVKLSEHVIDGNGNMVSYKSMSSLTKKAISHFNLSWICSSANPAGDVK